MVYGNSVTVLIIFLCSTKTLFCLSFLYKKREYISKEMETGFAVIPGILGVALLAPFVGKSNIDTTLIALLSSALFMTCLLKPSIAVPKVLRANFLITYCRR